VDGIKKKYNRGAEGKRGRGKGGKGGRQIYIKGTDGGFASDVYACLVILRRERKFIHSLSNKPNVRFFFYFYFFDCLV
jgi:hypothetical protein